MNQEERKTAIRRMRVLVAAACILMLLYGLRLIFLQLVNGDDFKSQATNTTDYKFTVTAARGDIVDSRGERIATSVTGYNVVLNKLLMGDEDLDGMLQKIVELLRANGESWNDTLLISQPDAAGNYTFTAEEGSTKDQKALAAMKDNLGLQQYATANDVMEKLVEDYDLASYPLSWQRTLGGIHYEMQLQAFSNVNNFIMAENVSEVTVATIKEHSLSLPGVEIVETSTRSYEQSTVLPHVLGRVGKITAEKWKVTDENGQTTYPLREKGYNMNDIIGISGLESAYEDELRGKDGVETITRNSDGVIVDTALTTVPEPGHTVQLTIDNRFQKAVDKALAENIDMINRVYNTGSMKAAAGAAVGQADDKVGSRLLQGGHGTLRRIGNRLKLHARHGGVAVRLLSHQAEDTVADAAPLQNQVVPDAVAVPRRPGIHVLRRGLVVGLDNGGHRIAALHGGVEHLRQAAGAVVKLMVAQRRGVVPHRAQGPQLRGLRGVDGLEQTAHGKVSGVQNQGVRVGRPLLLDQGGQTGIAAVFPALLIRHGEEVVVGVMGEQDRRFISGCVSRGQPGQRPGQQAGRQAQPKRAYANRMMHLIPSSTPSLPHFSEKGKPQPGL